MNSTHDHILRLIPVRDLCALGGSSRAELWALIAASPVLREAVVLVNRRPMLDLLLVTVALLENRSR